MKIIKDKMNREDYIKYIKECSDKDFDILSEGLRVFHKLYKDIGLNEIDLRSFNPMEFEQSK